MARNFTLSAQDKPSLVPEREVQTGVGAVKVKAPRVRDRGTDEKIRFQSSVLPKYVRRTKSLEALIPWLYLKGVSSNAMQDALSALLGPDAPNLSPDTISRLTKSWVGKLEAWEQRDLSARHYVYLWADGIYFQARTESDNLCMLVIIGATPEGKKELVGFTDGYRESTQSWRELLLDLKARGLALAPHSHHESDRKHFCDGSASYPADEGVPVPRQNADHGLQVDQGCREKLAPPARPKSIAKTDHRRKVRRRE